MYVCICNALRERDFVAAFEALGPSAEIEAFYRHLGCEPQCGTCIEEVFDRLKARHGSVAAE